MSAMRFEYEAIAAAGFDPQVDRPDLAMGRHIQYASFDLPEFRKRATKHAEAPNHALRNIPAERVRTQYIGATTKARTATMFL